MEILEGEVEEKLGKRIFEGKKWMKISVQCKIKSTHPRSSINPYYDKLQTGCFQSSDKTDSDSFASILAVFVKEWTLGVPYSIFTGILRFLLF